MRRVLGFAGLCAIAVSPIALSLAGSPVGGFRMFTDPVRYRIDALAELDGLPPVRIPMAALRDHLSADARRVLGGADAWTIGETNAALVADGLDDLATLVCELRPSARGARVILHRQRLSGEPLPDAIGATTCTR